MYFTALSIVLVLQGKFEQVVELGYQCREYREKALGERNPARLDFETELSYALMPVRKVQRSRANSTADTAIEAGNSWEYLP